MSRNALQISDDCPVCDMEEKYWRTYRSPETGRLRRLARDPGDA